MEIRNATYGDLDVLMEVFTKARRFMEAQGNPDQWRGGYPARGLVAGDIGLGQCYACVEDGRVVGTFVLARGEEPTYARIEGAWKNNRPYATLHRIASSGGRRGLSDEILSWAFARAGNLRGDTHADNLPMRRAFERNGFERCGTIWVKDGSPRIAYQREK